MLCLIILRRNYWKNSITAGWRIHSPFLKFPSLNIQMDTKQGNCQDSLTSSEWDGYAATVLLPSRKHFCFHTQLLQVLGTRAWLNPRWGSTSCPSHGPAVVQSMESDCSHAALPAQDPPAQGLSRPWALWMQRVSRQSLTCVHNSCWPPLSPSRHLSEPEICRASPGCLFDALFLNNSQIFKQHFYQHYMFRRHPGMSRVPELAGPHWAQPCSSAELLSGLQLTPAHALPLASGAELSAPRQEGSRETGWVCTVWQSETPAWLWFSWDLILGDNTEPKVTAEHINIQFFVLLSLCLSVVCRSSLTGADSTHSG